MTKTTPTTLTTNKTKQTKISNVKGQKLRNTCENTEYLSRRGWERVGR